MMVWFTKLTVLFFLECGWVGGVCWVVVFLASRNFHVRTLYVQYFPCFVELVLEIWSQTFQSRFQSQLSTCAFQIWITYFDVILSSVPLWFLQTSVALVIHFDCKMSVRIVCWYIFLVSWDIYMPNCSIRPLRGSCLLQCEGRVASPVGRNGCSAGGRLSLSW